MTAMNDSASIQITFDPLPTQFAPAERALPETVQAQAERFLAASPQMRVVLDAVPDAIVVLNRQRQIVFANRSAQALLERHNGYLLGLRPGEALNCVHAYETEGGCGTAAFCSTCGAVRAILESQRGQTDVQECRIIVRGSSDALDLRVWAVPFELDDDKLTIFTIHDIRDEKRRRALERIFFHDVLNTAGAISTSTELILDDETAQPKELLQILAELSAHLIEEIRSQRDLLSAETNELTVCPAHVDAHEMLHTLAESYRRQPLAENRIIQVAPSDGPATLVSDPTLLRRVLGNMLKNALEATPPAGVVTLGCRSDDEQVEFWVHNPTAMTYDVQLQVFQRSFSTKGTGRGLGTYSIKLLSERYLQGRVTFETSPAAGTTFRAIYPRAIHVN